MIQLSQGSIFNSKCDLLIVPCNSMGGMTNSIRKELVVNELPYLNRSVEAGEVVYIQNSGKFANVNIMVRQSRQSGVARATCPD